MQILEDAEKLRSKNNLLLNSCRLSLQHLNKVQLLANIDEEVRQLNHDNNRFLLSDTNALLHQLVKDGDSSFVFEKIGTNIHNVMIDEFRIPAGGNGEISNCSYWKDCLKEQTV